MDEPLENAYFKWLCAKVIQNQQPSTPSLTYWKLLKLLHGTEFVWLLVGDDNRAMDGLELRDDFIFECHKSVDLTEWRRELGCSILEMLIAFSRRAEFDTEIPAQDWFWEFIDNLGLKECNDGSDFKEDDIEIILDRFVWRTYNVKGEGGILPISNPHKHGDQRKIEIWHQFYNYLLDQDRL
jgi:hypothetical protein